MSFKKLVEMLQGAMNQLGENLKVDGDLGPKTEAAMEKYDIAVIVSPKKKEEESEPVPPPVLRTGIENPAYLAAKKHEGKNESDKTFGAWLSKFWPKVGLPNYKTIIGSAFAWCGLFIFAVNTEVGQRAISGAAGARNWAKYGVEVEWKKNGIPRGAVMHLNHAGNCNSASGNHVTFADGDCTVEDLTKAGATVPGFGGNQGNTVKRSIYPVKEICQVRWPSEVPLPVKITKSVDCQGSKSTGESTR